MEIWIGIEISCLQSEFFNWNISDKVSGGKLGIDRENNPNNIWRV